VLVVDHYDSYTWNLVHLIAAVTGVVPDVVEHDQHPDLSGYSHLVLSPGPGNPVEVSDFALGEIVFSLGVPVLGVCLGMQGLVTHFGGRVERVEPAHGDLAVVNHDQDGLFAGIPDPFRAVRYHSLAAVELPRVLHPTAVDETDGVVMAVAHRDLPLYGVQFHPESVLSEHGEEIVANFLALT
jgi:anthranilate synthase/aminodeoxychorismate synthase-like glutamine amidotransferase